jgi:hypothetical protein
MLTTICLHLRLSYNQWIHAIVVQVIGAQDVVIPQLDDALEWCEERVLVRYVITL